MLSLDRVKYKHTYKSVISVVLVAVCLVLTFLSGGSSKISEEKQEAAPLPEITPYLTSLSIQRRDEASVEWVNIGNGGQIHSGDTLRFHLSFLIPSGELSAYRNVLSYKLPGNIHFSQELFSQIHNSGGGLIGSCTVNSSGEITACIRSEQAEKNHAGEKINASLEFECPAAYLDSDEQGAVKLLFPGLGFTRLVITDKYAKEKINLTSDLIQENDCCLLYTAHINAEVSSSTELMLKCRFDNAEPLYSTLEVIRSGRPISITLLYTTPEEMVLKLPDSVPGDTYSVSLRLSPLEQSSIRLDVKAYSELSTNTADGEQIYERSDLQIWPVQNILSVKSKVKGEKYMCAASIKSSEVGINGGLLSAVVNGEEYNDTGVVKYPDGTESTVELPYTIPDSTGFSLTLSTDCSTAEVQSVSFALSTPAGRIFEEQSLCADNSVYARLDPLGLNDEGSALLWRLHISDAEQLKNQPEIKPDDTLCKGEIKVLFSSHGSGEIIEKSYIGVDKRFFLRLTPDKSESNETELILSTELTDLPPDRASEHRLSVVLDETLVSETWKYIPPISCYAVREGVNSKAVLCHSDILDEPQAAEENTLKWLISLPPLSAFSESNFNLNLVLPDGYNISRVVQVDQSLREYVARNTNERDNDKIVSIRTAGEKNGILEIKTDRAEGVFLLVYAAPDEKYTAPVINSDGEIKYSLVKCEARLSHSDGRLIHSASRTQVWSFPSTGGISDYVLLSQNGRICSFSCCLYPEYAQEKASDGYSEFLLKILPQSKDGTDCKFDLLPDTVKFSALIPENESKQSGTKYTVIPCADNSELLLRVAGNKPVMLEFSILIEGENECDAITLLSGENGQEIYSGALMPLEEEPTAKALRVYTVNEKDMSERIQGAKFKLERFDIQSGEYVPVCTAGSKHLLLETNENGFFTLDTGDSELLTYNCAYRLSLSKAPKGFCPSESEYCFYLESEDGFYPVSRPMSFEGDILTGDSAYIFLLKSKGGLFAHDDIDARLNLVIFCLILTVLLFIPTFISRSIKKSSVKKSKITFFNGDIYGQV